MSAQTHTALDAQEAVSLCVQDPDEDDDRTYSFEELSDDAKETAREWWREQAMSDSDYSESVIEYAQEAAKLLGIEFESRSYRTSNGRGPVLSHSEPDICQDSDEATEDALLAIMRDFADWIYSSLEAEYDYQMSDEAVDEAIIGNEYKFDEDGHIA